MLKDGMILIGMNEAGEYISLLPAMANRHGLITGATGTGKTVTIKVMAESFSDMGVPVFIADFKGDVAGLHNPGTDSEDMQERIARFKIGDTFQYRGFPVSLWDIYGEQGVRVRTTVSEMGPLLLARILGLNDTQSDLLTVAFKIADDNQMLLVDTKDLKALLNYVAENKKAFMIDYGNITDASVATIVRSIVALESVGGDKFFGEPALAISDWLQLGADGKGMINILDSTHVLTGADAGHKIDGGRLYATFLLWMLSELFEQLPEVGDMDKPRVVFFFDEAHLLFSDAPKALLDKVEQVVKLIRSRGIGIYFCTQNPRDIPDGVLAQLSNKIQHGLRAFTPAEQKAVRAAADSFRENSAFDTYDTILNLGTGEAVISFLNADGTPGVCEKVAVLPLQSNFNALEAAAREQIIKGSIYYSKYANPVDNFTAYEFLERMRNQPGSDQAAFAEAEAVAGDIAASEAKALEKERKAMEKEAAKLAAAEERKRKQMSNAVGGTVGRELGKTIGGAIFGKFGKTLGGNIGAQLGRNLLGTFTTKNK